LPCEPPRQSTTPPRREPEPTPHGAAGVSRTQTCRLAPFEGRSAGNLVGPPGTCLSAAWSPDGRWMYFAAQIGKSSHLWRQRFPAGDPEQITFGPTRETAVVAAPDGHSLLTSLGNEESAIWVHDANGERRLAAKTSGWQPWLSGDGARLYHLRRSTSQSGKELMRVDLHTDAEQALLPGIDVQSYDISADEREILFTTGGGHESQIWLAPIDRHAPPRRMAQGGDQAVFGGPGTIYFRRIGPHESSVSHAY
jgi:eukaryotic-like serine/threonine-protein kinase